MSYQPQNMFCGRPYWGAASIVVKEGVPWRELPSLGAQLLRKLPCSVLIPRPDGLAEQPDDRVIEHTEARKRPAEAEGVRGLELA